MPEHAVFVDRDNTIIANDGYLGDPTKVKLLPGAGAALASLRRIGYRIIVVSNQSGVARGLFTEHDVEAVNKEMSRQLLQQAGAHIDASYFCPYHPDAVNPQYRGDHDWRKPRAGMLKQAAVDFNLDMAQCWMIGDQTRDIAAGAAVGARTILLRDATVPPDKDNLTEASPTPDFVVKTLADAARIIVREGANVPKYPVSMPTLSRGPMDASALDPLPISDSISAKSSVNQSIKALYSPNTNGIKSTGLAPLLEEIVQQIRQINRHTQAPEFSFWSLIAAILQIAVVLFLAMAMWDGLSAGTHLEVTDINWWYDRTSNQLAALEWLLAGMILQSMVLTIHLIHRHR